VDLKLKHNSVIDSNSSLKLAMAATRQGQVSLQLGVDAAQQGRTIMTFTIVTIIFVSQFTSGSKQSTDPLQQLPLSFLTTVFQLDIKQFQGNAQGKYDLAYVSEIIC
jgi:hypothetical protein